MFRFKELNIEEKENIKGTYVCSNCSFELFASDQKFESGCGFPSFWSHVDDHVKFNPLDTYGRHRIQLLCNNCGQHLGHLFDNKLTPTKVRYCVNENAIIFKPSHTSA